MSVTIFAKPSVLECFFLKKEYSKKGVQKTENDTREEIQSRGQYLALLHDLRFKFAWKKKKIGKTQQGRQYVWVIHN